MEKCEIRISLRALCPVPPPPQHALGDAAYKSAGRVQWHLELARATTLSGVVVGLAVRD